MPVSPGASGMQPRDPCRPWRGTLASGHKPRGGLLALQSLESNAQLSFATRVEDWTCLGQHKRHPEFPVVTRESRRNSRKTTAQAAGLTVDNGIVVDEHLRSSDPDIYAAGDVAAFPAAALGRRIRVEHENAAVTMGERAGRCMAGQDAPYDELPFFYSDLFDLGYEAVGTLDARFETVEQWVTPFREGVVYYLEAGRVRGALLWNTWDQVGAARKLIAESGPFDAKSVRGRLPAA